MKRYLLLLCTMMFGFVAMAQMSPSLTVSPQMPMGTTITIDSVTLVQDGFVVVHAYDTNGELVLTPPLGLVYLEAGTHDGVAIELDAALLEQYGYGMGTKDVLPMIHIDDGDQTYEFPEGPDVPVMVNDAMVVAKIALTLGGDMSAMDHDMESMDSSDSMDSSMDHDMSDMASSEMMDISAMTPALSVSDQSVQGYSVTVDSATLAEDGFVVVHAFDTNGDLVLTPPLGLVYLEAGTHQNVVIELDPALLAEYGYGTGTKNVLPMIHIDDGDQVYEFPEGPDVPVVVDGGPVVANIALTLEPTLHVFDQTHVNGTVTIDTATLNDDGFIVVHAYDTNGELVLTPPLGLTYLEAGVHRYVTVELDTALLEQYGYTDTKNVLPMIHIDGNANGTYEFPEGPDVPVMVNEEMVVANISLSQPGMEPAAVNVEPAPILAVGGMGINVTIPSVTLAQPGYVALHTVDEAGELVVLPVLAVSDYLAAGTHENVTIQIDEANIPAVGDTIYAMLHYDDGNMVYTFPNSDAPVTMGEAIVMGSFELQ